MKQLVIGGVRSGKSLFAEKTAQALYTKRKESQATSETAKLVYLATGAAFDTSMQERIKKHQDRRASHWQLIEEPLMIADIVSTEENQKATILIDCMTLWLTNLLMADEHTSEVLLQEKIEQFIHALNDSQADIIIVTSEVGQGVMPMNALARRYADELGELNQKLAECCDKVTLITAGLPLALK